MTGSITLSTGTLHYFGLERTIATGKEAGFDNFELMLRNPGSDGYLDTWDKKYLDYLIQKYDIAIHSLHTDFGLEDEPRDIASLFNLADALQVEHIVMHIPRLGFDKYKEWFDKFVNSGILQKDPRILIENMGKKALYKTLPELQSYPNFCFDTCHSIKAEENTLELIKALPNVRQIHISNYNGTQTHVGLKSSEELFTLILWSQPSATRCVEMSPAAFADLTDHDAVVSLLKNTRLFIEECDR